MWCERQLYVPPTCLSYNLQLVSRLKFWHLRNPFINGNPMTRKNYMRIFKNRNLKWFPTVGFLEKSNPPSFCSIDCKSSFRRQWVYFQKNPIHRSSSHLVMVISYLPMYHPIQHYISLKSFSCFKFLFLFIHNWTCGI